MIEQKSKVIAGDGIPIPGYEIKCNCGASTFLPVRKPMPPEWVPKHFEQKGWEIHTDGKTLCAACVKKRIGRPPKTRIKHHGSELIQTIIGLPLTDKNMEKVTRNIGLPVDKVDELDTKKHDRKFRITMLPHADISSPLMTRAEREMATTFDMTLHSSVLAVSVLTQTSQNVLLVRAAMVWTVTLDKRGQ